MEKPKENKFIDDEKLNFIVNDIENYIAKKQPSILEYTIILDLLKERLQQRKNESKLKKTSDNLIKKALGKMGMNYEIEE